jgi:hypothetical protein
LVLIYSLKIQQKAWETKPSINYFLFFRKAAKSAPVILSSGGAADAIFFCLGESAFSSN